MQRGRTVTPFSLHSTDWNLVLCSEAYRAWLLFERWPLLGVTVPVVSAL